MSECEEEEREDNLNIDLEGELPLRVAWKERWGRQRGVGSATRRGVVIKSGITRVNKVKEYYSFAVTFVAVFFGGKRRLIESR